MRPLRLLMCVALGLCGFAAQAQVSPLPGFPLVPMDPSPSLWENFGLGWSGALVDVTGDGVQEIVQGGTFGTHVWFGSGVYVPGWPQFPTSPPLTGSDSFQMAVAVDSDGPGAHLWRIGALFNPPSSSTLSQQVFGWAADGASLPGFPKELQSYPQATGFPYGLALADVNWDGSLDVVSGSPTGKLFIMRQDGTFIPPTGSMGSFVSMPTVQDLDGDGSLELTLFAYPGIGTNVIDMSGQWRSGFPFPYGASEPQSPLVADIDHDGRYDILVSHPNQYLWVLDAGGNQLPAFGGASYGPGLNQGGVSLADVDGDRHLEVVWGAGGYGSQSGTIIVVRDDGTVQPGWPQYAATYPVGDEAFMTQPTVADIDGDGRTEILAGTALFCVNCASHVYAWHSDGTMVSGFPVALWPNPRPGWDEEVSNAAALVGDVNGDGNVDIIQPGSMAVFGWTLPYPYDPSDVAWATYRGDPQRSGVLPIAPDSTPPRVVDRFPWPGSGGAAPGQVITMHVRDSGTGVRPASIKLDVNGSTVTPTVTGDFGDYRASYIPPAPLPLLSRIDVRVRASDAAYGTNNQLDATYSFYVTGATDIDGDGLPDGWEILNKLDPSSSAGRYGASGDPDRDGLTNIMEYQQGLDATSPHRIVVGKGPFETYWPELHARYLDGTPVSGSEVIAFSIKRMGLHVGSGRIESAASFAHLVAPGPSPAYGPQVRAFRASAQPIAKVNFYAYGTLRYGAKVSSGDLDADSLDEILTGPGAGAVFGPHVRGFNYDGVALSAMTRVSFYAYATPRYGVNVVGGDFDEDGFSEMETGPGPSGSFASQVRLFNYDGVGVSGIAKVNYVAFPGSSWGAVVASGDVDADAMAEMLVAQGPGPSLGPRVRGFNYDGVLLQPLAGLDFVAFGAGQYGAGVAGGDLDGDGIDEMVCAHGPDPGSDSRVKGFNYDGSTLGGIAGADFLRKKCPGNPAETCPIFSIFSRKIQNVPTT